MYCDRVKDASLQKTIYGLFSEFKFDRTSKNNAQRSERSIETLTSENSENKIYHIVQDHTKIQKRR